MAERVAVNVHDQSRHHDVRMEHSGGLVKVALLDDPRYTEGHYVSEPLASRSRCSFCGARRRALINQLDTYCGSARCGLRVTLKDRSGRCSEGVKMTVLAKTHHVPD